jgi:protein-L-isoaspartate(D-aspartate) O-methyltransferase
MKIIPTLGSSVALLVVALLLCPAANGQGNLTMKRARDKMVEEIIIGGGIKNERVIKSMRATPRHEFVRRNERKFSYEDWAMPIGESQTISPPFIVAYMTEQLDPQPSDKVLEIGTGSGYQAAVLSPLARSVYTIEIVRPLGLKAARTLKRLRYENVHTKIGDGYKGWPENAPFDRIIVTCSPDKVPQALISQLKEGGRMVIPVGERYQQTMYLFTKKDGKLVKEALRPTLFVPMTGRAESLRKDKPDPLNPRLFNGGFELFDKLSNMPHGWYYQRQMELIEGADAPEGTHHVRLKNEQIGREAGAYQGFPVDGRRVKELKVSIRVRTKNVRPGEKRSDLARLTITFFDEKRSPVGSGSIGPWHGTFNWDHVTGTIKVPQHAREGFLHIGLRGGTGEVLFDDVKVGLVK